MKMLYIILVISVVPAAVGMESLSMVRENASIDKSAVGENGTKDHLNEGSQYLPLVRTERPHSPIEASSDKGGSPTSSVVENAASETQEMVSQMELFWDLADSRKEWEQKASSLYESRSS